MIFIDTGAFIARYRRSDQWHDDAVGGWAQLARGSERVFTSGLVIAEGAKLLEHLLGAKRAADRVAAWLSSRELRILRSGNDEELEATVLMRKYADQAIGFTDCVSFVLMRHNGIRRAFCFDRHFATAGFELWPVRGRR